MSDAREWLAPEWWSPRRQDAMRDALLAVLGLHRRGGRFVGSDERYCSACGLGTPWP